MALSKTSKIYIAGHHGLVGSAIWKNLEARGYSQLIGRSHSELDLTNQQAVDNFFKTELIKSNGLVIILKGNHRRMIVAVCRFIS